MTREEKFGKPHDNRELPRFNQLTNSISSEQIAEEQCGSVSVGVRQWGETLSLPITNNKMEVGHEVDPLWIKTPQHRCTIGTLRVALLAAAMG